MPRATCPARWLSSHWAAQSEPQNVPFSAWVTISRWQRDGIRDRELRKGEKEGRVDKE